jgi:hypothetical protein
VVGWSAALAASGFTLIWAVAGPDATDVKDSVRTSGIVLGALLFPLALYPLWNELRALTAARTASVYGGAPAATPPPAQPAWTPTPRPPATSLPTAAAGTPAPASGSGIDRLNALARERDSGAITPEEYERRKAEILTDLTRGL